MEYDEKKNLDKGGFYKYHALTDCATGALKKGYFNELF